MEERWDSLGHFATLEILLVKRLTVVNDFLVVIMTTTRGVSMLFNCVLCGVRCLRLIINFY